eukprot:CAMPEP_0194219652 /NCGR_PEP_ID=MMETSP0156-20130528/26480_1 /TAXON_ID=33649 /ORGANISM="Thalassionema nitzschioides, Strain L26-B" /LENGTH=837 /DNA_ID=CAMNT_0038949405 /DNA_START=176 /DNA_END=2689 /DNA_ORIENTATION=-
MDNKADDGRAKNGLSELSKQLRVLQSKNHEQAATIDNLERKLKILTDLKGVSLNDMKSALWDACQGEAFNELTAEVRTLRSQLDLTKNNNNDKISFSEKHATQDIANLELRVGELEEVEESLQNQISELYESLRKKSSRVTELEASCDQYKVREKELKEKYKAMEEKLVRENRAAIEKLEQELETASSKIHDAECYSLKQKEMVDSFIIQVAEYKGLEVQLTESKQEIQQLRETMSRKEIENNKLHQAEIESKERKIEALQHESDKLKSKEQSAKRKIKDLEGHVAKMFSLELTIAKQKVQLKEITEEKTKSNKNMEEMHQTKLDTAKMDIENFQAQAQSMEIKLRSEYERASELEKQVQLLEHVERKNAELEDELSSEKQKFQRYKEDNDKEITDERTKIKKKLSECEAQVSELQDKVTKLENEREGELEKQTSIAKRLEETCQEKNEKLSSLSAEVDNLNEQVLKLRKENESALADVSEKNTKLNDFEMKHKIEKSKADSLQKQIKSVEKEAKLRKNQFKSRFTVQSDRIKDLEQQLSSLYTAFNLERGERTEEQKNHDELRLKLDMADSKVAHQLHNYEEEKKGVSPKVPVGTETHSLAQQANVAAAAPKSPQKQMIIRQIEEDTIVEGYLLKKEKYKWKKRFFVLHGSLETGNFKLSHSDGKGKPNKGVVTGIRGSISRAFESKKFPKQPTLWPFTFILKVNPYDADDDKNTLAFAANNKQELDMWVNAFDIVTSVVPTEDQTEDQMSHQTSHQTSPTAPIEKKPFDIGSKVVIVDLKKHPDYNGLTGIIKGPLEDNRQVVLLDELKQEVKLSPANLELFSMPDETSKDYEIV